MAKIGNFDANQHEPMQSNAPLPQGKYLAQIVESELKTTKNGTGKYLELVLQVIDGEYKNRKLWVRLNIHNANAQAVEIAKAELSAICRAIGKYRIQDSAELHNVPMIIDVRLSPRKDTGELENRVRGYEPRAVPAAATAPQKSRAKPKPTPDPEPQAESAPWADQPADGDNDTLF